MAGLIRVWFTQGAESSSRCALTLSTGSDDTFVFSDSSMQSHPSLCCHQVHLSVCVCMGVTSSNQLGVCRKTSWKLPFGKWRVDRRSARRSFALIGVHENEDECLKDELGLIICFDLTVIIRTSRDMTRTQTLSQAAPFTKRCTQLQRKPVAVTAAWTQPMLWLLFHTVSYSLLASSSGFTAACTVSRLVQFSLWR